MPMAREPQDNRGKPAARIDAYLKVTGGAKYAGDFALAGSAYAVLVSSAIARGSIAAIDLSEARAVDGMLDIFSHLNCAGKLQSRSSSSPVALPRRRSCLSTQKRYGMTGRSSRWPSPRPLKPPAKPPLR